MSKKPCSVVDCDRPSRSRGFCPMHHKRWLKGGDPTYTAKKQSPAGSLLDWIRANASHTGDDCLPWPFSRDARGRPSYIQGGRPPRIMCEMAHGPSPSPSHQAAHSCGNANEGCVNPRHLRWATPVENAADKLRHGTVRRGKDNLQARLDDQAVIEIRRLYGEYTTVALAPIFGVHPSTIGKIVTRKCWKHVP